VFFSEKMIFEIAFNIQIGCLVFQAYCTLRKSKIKSSYAFNRGFYPYSISISFPTLYSNYLMQYGMLHNPYPAVILLPGFFLADKYPSGANIRP
jgi:hypothetical protein